MFKKMGFVSILGFFFTAQALADFGVVGSTYGECANPGPEQRAQLTQEAREDALWKAKKKCQGKAKRVSSWKYVSTFCDYYISGQGYRMEKALFRCLNQNNALNNSKSRKSMSNSHFTHIDFKELLKKKPQIEGENIKVWSIKKDNTIRINFVEFFGRLGLHKHPDADHSIMIFSGQVKVTIGDSIIIANEGDFVSIPKNIPHSYFSLAEVSRFVSMDAPYYDPKNTIPLE